MITFLTSFSECFWSVFSQVCNSDLGLVCILFVMFGLFFSYIYRFVGRGF